MMLLVSIHGDLPVKIKIMWGTTGRSIWISLLPSRSYIRRKKTTTTTTTTTIVKSNTEYLMPIKWTQKAPVVREPQEQRAAPFLCLYPSDRGRSLFVSQDCSATRERTAAQQPWTWTTPKDSKERFRRKMFSRVRRFRRRDEYQHETCTIVQRIK